MFYALFSALSFMALIPMLDVLFKENAVKVTEKPVFQGVGNLKDYLSNSLNYQITSLVGEDSQKALFVVILPGHVLHHLPAKWCIE